MNKKANTNIIIINTFSSLILQILLLINGFIVPWLILSYFGSEVNGLVSSLTKFLSYISLLEGGLTGVVMANLYKPLVEKDNEKLSSVVNTTIKFYKKITKIFIIYTMVLAIIYPLIFNTGFSYIYIFLLTLILSITSLIQYNFSLTYKTLLSADKKVYMVANTQSVLVVLSIILSYISLKVFPEIHIFKLVAALVYIIQPFVFNYYVKKNYDLTKNAEEDNDLLKSRWDGFSINIAAFIHTNTDMILLSFFTNMTTVSVYSIYALVASGLRTVLSFLSNGIKPSIGQLYARNEYAKLSERIDDYELVVFFLVFVLFSVSSLLITPFVMIYTKNITDADYYQPLFGILLMISEGFYLIKTAHVDLAYAANRFKDMKIPCYIEALINILISLILIKPLGLIGVAIGTLVAMIYRMIYHVWYTNSRIINRSQLKFYKQLISFSFSTIIGVAICLCLFSTVQYTISSWIIHGIMYSIVMGLIYVINCIVFYRKIIIKIFNKINLLNKSR